LEAPSQPGARIGRLEREFNPIPLVFSDVVRLAPRLLLETP